jgi:1-acyl-sn-glycerol-3-phosphate acyltransferase
VSSHALPAVRPETPPTSAIPPHSGERPSAKLPYSDRGRSFKALEYTMRALRAYHRHEAFGLENVPRSGPGIVVCNHALATYDSWLLAIPVGEECGREMTGLGAELTFKIPVVRDFFADFTVPGTRENAEKLLREGELLLTFPGGVREMLRGSAEKYRVHWRGRLGFVRLSLATGAPILLTACPRADDIFTVYRNPITELVYSRLRAPLPLFRGLGPTLLPRPVKLWHLISEPIFPDVAPDQWTERDLHAHHERLEARMNRLLQEALACVSGE